MEEKRIPVFDKPLKERSSRLVLEWMKGATIIDASVSVDHYGDVFVHWVVLQKESGEVYTVKMIYPGDCAGLYRYIAPAPFSGATNSNRPEDWEEISAADYLNNSQR
ncbi:MAG: hypothetical protein PHG93_06135 [Candidatus Methanomethylophilaceae archaeon]|nr:hypothetical protein [Candidatus Methanomethylophilaceae archaeon]